MKVENDYPNQLPNTEEGAQAPSSLYSAPTDMVDLPSRGKIYPKSSPLHKGRVEVKYMTAKEEDILATESFIRDGTVLDRLIKSVIVTPGVDINEMIQGDVDALTIATRVFGYGGEYSGRVETPSGKVQTTFFDLTKLTHEVLEDEWLVEEGKNEFAFMLPHSKIQITFKLLTRGESDKLREQVKDSEIGMTTTLFKNQIVSVAGNYDKGVIADFVENGLLARDARSLKEYIDKVTPKVNLSLEVIDRETNQPFQSDIPISPQFLWPDFDV